ncbi:MAG: carboxypeptidase regulatory-like domain-containing protein [Acidobacteria bacterium]|nr:MAG: carboxypeptidase regulatory-like domain-containing protein [Acidobacteriota bacterium]
MGNPGLRTALILFLVAALAAPAAADPAGLSGVIETPPGVPIAGYRLRLESDKGVAIETLPLGQDGRFHLAAVPPGRYVVRLLTFDGRTCRVEFPPIVVDGRSPAEVRLRLAEKPVCHGARPGRWSQQGGRKAWILGGSVLAAALLAAALGGGGGEEPTVSPSSP